MTLWHHVLYIVNAVNDYVDTQFSNIIQISFFVFILLVMLFFNSFKHVSTLKDYCISIVNDLRTNPRFSFAFFAKRKIPLNHFCPLKMRLKIGNWHCPLKKKHNGRNVAESKLFNFGSSSGATFFLIFAPAPAPIPALYWLIKKLELFWFDNIYKTRLQK